METNNKPKNPEAFPNTIVNNMGAIIGGQNGMTLRDYFANSAMKGIISNSDLSNIISGNNGMPNPEYVSEVSYQLADAMLKQREKQI